MENNLTVKNNSVALFLELFVNMPLLCKAIDKKILKTYRLNTSKLTVLSKLFVASHNGLTITELSSTLCTTNANVSMMVDDLISKNWVSKTPYKLDNRVMFIRFTNDGINGFKQVLNDYLKVLEPFLNSLEEGSIDLKVISNVLLTQLKGQNFKL